MDCNNCKYISHCESIGRVILEDFTSSLDEEKQEVALLAIGRRCPIKTSGYPSSDNVFEQLSFAENVFSTFGGDINSMDINEYAREVFELIKSE